MSVKVFPRSEWTSTNPGFPRYSGRKINPLAVTHFRLHYPGDGNHERRHYNKGQSEQALRNYRDFHIRKRGWADIGYPLAADQSGRAWVAAGTSHAAAHSATSLRKNENWHSLAMLLMIGNNEPLTDALVETINGVWAGLIDGSLGLGKFPNMLTITAHNDVPGASTRCAGPQVDRLLAQGAFRPSAVSASPAPETDSEEDRMWFAVEKSTGKNYVGDGIIRRHLSDPTEREDLRVKLIRQGTPWIDAGVVDRVGWMGVEVKES